MSLAGAWEVQWSKIVQTSGAEMRRGEGGKQAVRVNEHRAQHRTQHSRLLTRATKNTLALKSQCRVGQQVNPAEMHKHFPPFHAEDSPLTNAVSLLKVQNR